MKKKTYIISGIVLVLIIVIAIYKSKSGGDAIAVTVEQAKTRTVIETVSANGKVQPEVEVKISPDVSGEIVELNVTEGMQVKKGDLLVKINPDIYISMKERAEAALNTSQSNLSNAKARLAQAKAQLINSEASFKRSDKLFKDGAISQADYDAANASYEVAKAEVEAAEHSVAAGEFNIKSASASLKEASDNLLRTTIFSPMDGTISSLKVEQGERVVGTSQMAGTEMMRIAELKNMEMNVEVNENDIVRVSHHDTVEIEVDAFLGRKFKGIVTEIANSANTLGVSAEQVTTFNVKISILRNSYSDLIPADKPHLSPFRPGMSGTVEIQTEKAENVLTVPIQAVTTREDTADAEEVNQGDEESMVRQKNDEREKLEKKKEVEECIFILKDGKAAKKIVKTGIQDSKYIQVISGIEENEEVISGPYSAVARELEDGSAVEKVEKKDLYKKYKEKYGK